MPIWPALFVAPSLALTHLSVAFALVTPACAGQQIGWLHGTSAAFLAATSVMTVMAFVEARRRAASLSGAGSMGNGESTGGSTRTFAVVADSDSGDARPHFTARVASLTGLLSCLVIVGIWIPQWLLSPCVA